MTSRKADAAKVREQLEAALRAELTPSLRALALAQWRELTDPAELIADAELRAAEAASRDDVERSAAGIVERRRARRIAQLDDLGAMAERFDKALGTEPDQPPLADRIRAEWDRLAACGTPERGRAALIARTLGCSDRRVRQVLRETEK